MRVKLSELARIRPLRVTLERRKVVQIREPRWGFTADGWSELQIGITELAVEQERARRG